MAVRVNFDFVCLQTRQSNANILMKPFPTRLRELNYNYGCVFGRVQLAQKYFIRPSYELTIALFNHG
jgi:hypothetical protein